jgi:hypothetical protein
MRYFIDLDEDNQLFAELQGYYHFFPGIPNAAGAADGIDEAIRKARK